MTAHSLQIRPLFEMRESEMPIDASSSPQGPESSDSTGTDSNDSAPESLNAQAHEANGVRPGPSRRWLAAIASIFAFSALGAAGYLLRDRFLPSHLAQNHATSPGANLPAGPMMRSKLRLGKVGSGAAKDPRRAFVWAGRTDAPIEKGIGSLDPRRLLNEIIRQAVLSTAISSPRSDYRRARAVRPPGFGFSSLRGYPVMFSCNSRYLNGIGFFNGSGFKSLSMR